MRPAVVALDVNETLSDLSPMAERFEEVGAPGHLAKVWFAGVLRDGFALTAVGEQASFRELATTGLRALLGSGTLDRDLDAAVEHVMGGFMELPLHPDVAPGLAAMASSGIRLVTLTNGASAVGRSLLERAGLGEHIEAYLSVDDAGIWKPSARAYQHALDSCAVDAGDTMLVAVHPWDIDGAHRAGLRTAWINRGDRTYPPMFSTPDIVATGIEDLARRLG